MKKFLSMVMAAAMVVSLVPATAFAAAGDFKATAKVVDAQNFPVDAINTGDKVKGSELQLTLTTADTIKADDRLKFTVTLDNATVDSADAENLKNDVYVKDGTTTYTNADFWITTTYVDEDEFDVILQEKGGTGDPEFARGMVIAIPLDDM